MRYPKDAKVAALGRLLAEARRTAGMTQAEACGGLPFKQSMLSDFESGVRAPSQDQLSALITRYGVVAGEAASLRVALGGIMATRAR